MTAQCDTWFALGDVRPSASSSDAIDCVVRDAIKSGKLGRSPGRSVAYIPHIGLGEFGLRVSLPRRVGPVGVAVTVVFHLARPFEVARGRVRSVAVEMGDFLVQLVPAGNEGLRYNAVKAHHAHFPANSQCDLGVTVCVEHGLQDAAGDPALAATRDFNAGEGTHTPVVGDFIPTLVTPDRAPFFASGFHGLAYQIKYRVATLLARSLQAPFMGSAVGEGDAPQ